jgi:protein-tyrosine phosphatase
MVKVLFVCMGNICRSPTAHGVFEAMVRDEGLEHIIEIDSAGTHAYHVGEPPDRRSQQSAVGRGYRLDHLRARKVASEDFALFDYVIAMDHANYNDLQLICPTGFEQRLSLFMDFAPDFGRKEVPDPYYGGDRGFEHVLDMVEEASKGLLEEILKRHP